MAANAHPIRRKEENLILKATARQNVADSLTDAIREKTWSFSENSLSRGEAIGEMCLAENQTSLRGRDFSKVLSRWAPAILLECHKSTSIINGLLIDAK